MTDVTKTPIQQSYFIHDIASAMITYNRMRWYRSTGGSSGPFLAATAPSAQPATVTAALSPPLYDVVGKELVLYVDGSATPTAYTFSGSAPLVLAEVVAQLAAVTGITATTYEDCLRLQTVSTGSDASLYVESTDASVALGISGRSEVGLDSDLTLNSSTAEYFYVDQNSSSEYWYAVELYSTTTGDRSGLSVGFPGDPPNQLPKANTILAYLRLVGIDGRGVPNKKVTLFSGQTALISGHAMLPTYSEATTDRNGYAEMRVLRGIRVTAAVEGSDLTRTFVTPTTGDAFNLFDSALDVVDEFGVKTARVNTAFRLS